MYEVAVIEVEVYKVFHDVQHYNAFQNLTKVTTQYIFQSLSPTIFYVKLRGPLVPVFGGNNFKKLHKFV